MEPATTNGIITEYRISYNLTDNNIITVTAGASDRTVTISDLAPFTVYEISVVAVTIVAGPATTINVQTEQAGLETWSVRSSSRSMPIVEHVHSVHEHHTLLIMGNLKLLFFLISNTQLQLLH